MIRKTWHTCNRFFPFLSWNELPGQAGGRLRPSGLDPGFTTVVGRPLCTEGFCIIWMG
jgi:hypothetical protein